jgi:hypothetical protein
MYTDNFRPTHYHRVMPGLPLFDYPFKHGGIQAARSTTKYSIMLNQPISGLDFWTSPLLSPLMKEHATNV